MKITVLIENGTCSSDLICEHGLSLYTETKKHTIIFDTGASDNVIKNANILNKDLRKADTIIISHGHYDHTGGLLAIASQNKNANIYMQKSAINDFYHGEKYIGIDKEIINLQNLFLCEGDTKIDDELFLFSNIKGRRLWPNGNEELMKKAEDKLTQDDFSHEQCLVISENNKKILISGCAHNGIINILERYYEIFSSYPNVVISGFHMMKKSPYSFSEIKNIKETAIVLNKLPILFYTGHCTSNEAYNIMKEIMKDQISPIYTGLEITI